MRAACPAWHLLPTLLLLAACGYTPAPHQDPPPPIIDQNTEPIEAPPLEWTWVDFPGTRCLDGSATGLGVNLSPTSKKVAIFLMGGGACFDAATCFTVANASGYKAPSFQSDVDSGLLARGAFNRDDPDNPFRDWSYVFVPYCTGDVFAGDNPDGYNGFQHFGYPNMGRYLDRLVPTFRDAEQVVLSGSSAGGVGAAFNFDRTQQAFGDVPVTLLDDSGIVLGDDYMKPCEQARWRDEWNLDQSLPPDCEDCTLPDGGGLVNLARFLAGKYPHRRMGMIASLQDKTFRLFFSYGYSEDCRQLGDTPAEVFQAGVEQLRDELLAPYPNFAVYSVASTKHVYLGDNPVGRTTSGGVKLTDWLRALVDGGPDFHSITP